MDKRLCYIANFYGIQKQLRQLVEECNELSLVACKSIRYNNLSIKEFIEEVADVEIMIEQIKYLANISEADIDEQKEFKLNRQVEKR